MVFESGEKMRVIKTCAGSALLLTCLALTGCGQPQAAQAPGKPPPPVVEVAAPTVEEVTDYEDFPGRTEAVYSVDVRAHVSGYLDKVNFQEGADVKEGDLLFEIDPRPFKAELDRAEAILVQAEARLKRLDTDYQRAASLLPRGAIGRDEYDRIVGDRAEAAAGIGVAKAAREMASLNLEYTRVRAKINGRVSRRFIDPGNLVKADDTVLTNIVSLAPVHASFDLDERTTIRLKKLVREGKIQWSQTTGMPVLLGLADEEDYSQKGTINFSDNRVDPETGTWRLRGEFTNADHVLDPGMFVRIRLPIGAPYRGLLVAEQALGTDQGQKFVYVVNDQGDVDYRRIKVGRLQPSGLRVVVEGLKPDEKIVVSGLQRVRPGKGTVSPKEVKMPGSGRSPQAGAGAATGADSSSPARTR
jgi:RND family efflux transporter MFP subunit